MFRIGKVIDVDEKTAKARVELEDLDKVITYWLPVVVQKTQDDKLYWLPDVGELVLVGFLNYGIEQGFIIGSFYNEQDNPPVADKNKIHIQFKDGTVIEYDRKNSKLLLDIKKDMTVNINNQLTLKSKMKIEEFQQANLKMNNWQIEGDITLNGNLLVMGNITSTGTTTAQSGLMTNPAGLKLMIDEAITTFNAHTHIGDSGGTTTPPNQQITGG